MPLTRRLRALAVVGAAILIVLAVPALAQVAHHPFAVGAGEGAVGHQTGLGAWLIGQESAFFRALTGAVGATKAGMGGALALVGLSFAYGVFHAAGPGHGKAVITSYMVSNEVALRRGFVLALLAALVQAGVAIAIVGVAALVFDATAARMTATAEALEVASYLGIVALGLYLVWRKGRALVAVLRPAQVSPAFMLAGASIALPTTSRFVADAGGALVHGADCDCGHAHMPDARTLVGSRFDWRAASIAVATAGARPCSGAILVLVYALSQEIFIAGIAATLAMALGTALTTGALATIAVLSKDTAMRLVGLQSVRALILGRAIELVAACAVLAFGALLLTATLAGVRAGG